MARGVRVDFWVARRVRIGVNLCITPLSAPPDKEGLIFALMARIEALVEQSAQLTARIAEREATLGLPPKSPDNSSTPPSKGKKPSGPSAAKANPHAGAHRPLHPSPTAKRDVFAATCRGCGADVSGALQRVCERYDRSEIPESRPDGTRVSLHGGICPCCATGFKAAPPVGLEPGSPFGPNLRAFVLYLRSVQGIPLARLCCVTCSGSTSAKARWSISSTPAGRLLRPRRA